MVVVNAGPAPAAARAPRWNTRPKHPADAPGELDFGQWHKDALPHGAYCMDVDKVEYRIDADGSPQVVGIYELIRWDWQHDVDDIPERLAPYKGKLKLLERVSRLIAEGQGAGFPAFIVWHRPDLSEVVVGRLEEWVVGPGKALHLGTRAFADLIRNLPEWRAEPTLSTSRRASGNPALRRDPDTAPGVPRGSSNRSGRGAF